MDGHDDREKTGHPQTMQGRPQMGEEPERRRRPDMKRKAELFQLAQGIAAQVGELTRPHERCLLRQMVEMLLEA